MLRPSFLAASALVLAPLAFAAACQTSTTTTTFTPITGIIIRSSTLVNGVGCGTAPDEVFKYVAFVAPAAAPANVQYATVVDCFADGVLVNLSTSTAQEFVVTILAFNEATWNAVGGELDPAVRDASGPPLQMLLQATEPQASWVTTCTATEQQQIQVLAVCGPLVPNGGADAGPPADAPPDVATTDASTDAPRHAASPPDAPPDAPGDASVDAAPDAAIDAPTDAPLDAAD